MQKNWVNPHHFKIEDDLKNFKMEDDLKNFKMEDDLKQQPNSTQPKVG